ncbi:hypothetical protein LINPERHAP1_LOCUS1184, partial [Linum perenne]
HAAIVAVDGRKAISPQLISFGLEASYTSGEIHSDFPHQVVVTCIDQPTVDVNLVETELEEFRHRGTKTILTSARVRLGVDQALYEVARAALAYHRILEQRPCSSPRRHRSRRSSRGGGGGGTKKLVRLFPVGAGGFQPLHHLVRLHLSGSL